MRISKYFIVLGLLAGAVAPVNMALKKDTKEARAVTEKDLATIISEGNKSYSYDYIGNFFFDFNLSEQIFTNTAYFNDHLTDGTFLDENNQNINIGEGILINGQTFDYWKNLTPDPLSYPRNEGVVAFPLYASKVFNPVAIEAAANKLAFKVNLDYFSMDNIVVTFKAGIFKGYNANTDTKYTLSEDLTFYSTLNSTVTSSNSGKISFVKARNEVLINGKISIEDKGEFTNSQGGKYHRFDLLTNIPINRNYVPDVYPATHFRFVYDNYKLNGKAFTTINSWARGNSKDFTDLASSTSITEQYETVKPGGAISKNECYALTIQYSSSNSNYLAYVYVPNQLVTDLSLETLTFTLRDGSAWFTFDENNNPIIGRVDNAAFTSLITAAKAEIANYVDLDDYDVDKQVDILTIIDEANEAIENALTEGAMNIVVANAKASIDLIPDTGHATEIKHINAVIALIDAIVTPIEYTAECGASINAAMEAYTTLTASEIAAFPSAKLDELYNAYSAFNALDLANYKVLSKAEIRAAYNALDYRPLEQSALADILEIADAAIDAATSKAMVESAVSAFRASLALIKTDAEYIAEELATAKTNAKAELDAINLDLYRTEERAKVEEIISKGKIAIDQCKSAQEVQTLLNKIKSVIASIKTDTQLSAQSAHDAQVAKQRRNIALISVAGSLALIAGVGLVALFVRKRKSN